MSDKPNEELNVDIPEKELSTFEQLSLDPYVLDLVANFDVKYQEIEKKAEKLDDTDPEKIDVMLALRNLKSARGRLVKIGKDIANGDAPFGALPESEQRIVEHKVQRVTSTLKKSLSFLGKNNYYELTQDVLLEIDASLLFSNYIKGDEVKRILSYSEYYEGKFSDKAKELNSNIDEEISEYKSVSESIFNHIKDYIGNAEHTTEERQEFYNKLKGLVREFRAVLYKLEAAGVYKMSSTDRNLYEYNNLPEQQEDYNKIISKLTYKAEDLGDREAALRLERLNFLKTSVDAYYEIMESQGGLSEDDGELLARNSNELNYLLYALDEEDDSISTLGEGKEFVYSGSVVKTKLESRKETDDRADEQWEWLEKRCLGVVDSARKAQSKLKKAYFDTNNEYKSGRYYLDILNVNISKTISFMLDVVDGKRPYDNSPTLPKTIGASVWNGDPVSPTKVKEVDPQTIEGAISIAEERLKDVDKFIKAYEIMDDVAEDRQKILEAFDDAVDYNKAPSKSLISQLKTSLKRNYDKYKKTGYLSDSEPYYRNGNFPVWESFSINSYDKKFLVEDVEEAFKLLDVMGKDMNAYFEVAKRVDGKILSKIPRKELESFYKKLVATYLGRHREIDLIKKYGKIFSKKFVRLMAAIEFELIGRETQNLNAIDIEFMIDSGNYRDFVEFVTPNSELDHVDKQIVPIPEYGNYIGKKILLKPALINLLKKTERTEEEKETLELFRKAFENIGIDLAKVSLTDSDTAEVELSEPVLLFNKFFTEFKEEGKTIDGVKVPYVIFEDNGAGGKGLTLTRAYYEDKKMVHENLKDHEDTARIIARIDSVIEHFALIKYMKIQKVQSGLETRPYVLDYYKADEYLSKGDKENAKKYYLSFLKGAKTNREKSQDPLLESKIEQAKSRLKMFAMDDGAKLRYHLGLLEESIVIDIEQNQTLGIGEAISNGLRTVFKGAGEPFLESVSKFQAHIIKDYVKSQQFAVNVASQILSKDNNILSFKEALEEVRKLHGKSTVDSVKYMEVLGFTDTDAATNLITSGDLSKWIDGFREYDKKALDEKWAEYKKTNPGAARLLKGIEVGESLPPELKEKYDQTFSILDHFSLDGGPTKLHLAQKLKESRMFFVSEKLFFEYFEDSGFFESAGLGKEARSKFYREGLTAGTELYNKVQKLEGDGLAKAQDFRVEQEKLSRPDKTLTKEEEDLIRKKVAQNYKFTVLAKLWKDHLLSMNVVSPKTEAEKAWADFKDDYHDVGADWWEFWEMTAQESGEFWTKMVMELPAFVAMGWGAHAAGEGISGLVMRRQAMKQLGKITVEEAGSMSGAAIRAKAAGFAAETFAFSQMMMLNSALPSGNVHYFWSPTEQLKSWGESVLTLGVLKLTGMGAKKIGDISRVTKTASLPFLPIVDAGALTGTQYLWHSAFESDQPFDARSAIRGNVAFSIGIRLGQRMMTGGKPSSKDRGIRQFNREQMYEKVMTDFDKAPEKGQRPTRNQIYKVADYLYDTGVVNFSTVEGMSFGETSDLVKWSKARGIDANSWETVDTLEARRSVVEKVKSLESRARDIEIRELLEVYSAENGQVIVEMLAKSSKAKLSKPVQKAAEFLFETTARNIIDDLPSVDAKLDMIDFLMSRFHARDFVLLEGTNLLPQDRVEMVEKVRDFETKVESFGSELMLGEAVAELYQSGKAGRLAAKILTADPNIKVEGRTRRVMDYMTESSLDVDIIEGMTAKESWNFALESINLDISRDTWRQFEGKDAKLKALESVRAEVDSVLTDPKKTVSKPDFDRLMNTPEGRAVLEILSKRSVVKFDVEYSDIVELAKLDALTADLFVENLMKNNLRMFNRISRQYSRDLIKELGMSKAELRELFGRAYEGHFESLQKIYDAFDKTGGRKLAIIAGSSLFLQGCSATGITIVIGSPVVLSLGTAYLLYRFRTGRSGRLRPFAEETRQNLSRMKGSFADRSPSKKLGQLKQHNDAFLAAVEAGSITNKAEYLEYMKKLRKSFKQYLKTLDPEIREKYKVEADKYIEAIEQGFEFDETQKRNKNKPVNRLPDINLFEPSDLMRAIESLTDLWANDLVYDVADTGIQIEMPKIVTEAMRADPAFREMVLRYKSFLHSYTLLLGSIPANHYAHYAARVPGGLSRVAREATLLMLELSPERIFRRANQTPREFRNDPTGTVSRATKSALAEFRTKLSDLDEILKTKATGVLDNQILETLGRGDLLPNNNPVVEQPREAEEAGPRESLIVERDGRHIMIEKARRTPEKQAGITPEEAFGLLSEYFRRFPDHDIVKKKISDMTGKNKTPGRGSEGPDGSANQQKGPSLLRRTIEGTGGFLAKDLLAPAAKLVLPYAAAVQIAFWLTYGTAFNEKYYWITDPFTKKDEDKTPPPASTPETLSGKDQKATVAAAETVAVDMIKTTTPDEPGLSGKRASIDRPEVVDENDKPWYSGEIETNYVNIRNRVDVFKNLDRIPTTVIKKLSDLVTTNDSLLKSSPTATDKVGKAAELALLEENFTNNLTVMQKWFDGYNRVKATYKDIDNDNFPSPRTNTPDFLAQESEVSRNYVSQIFILLDMTHNQLGANLASVEALKEFFEGNLEPKTEANLKVLLDKASNDIFEELGKK